MKKTKSSKKINFKGLFKKEKLPILIWAVLLIIIINILVAFLVIKNNNKETDKPKDNDQGEINYEAGTEDYFMDDVEEPEETPNTGNDYYDYIDTPLAKINFSDLKKKNFITPDIVL